jgi:hypothetical protein
MHSLLEFIRHEIMLMKWCNRKTGDPVVIPCVLIGLFLGLSEGDMA